jgi:hypothetical protein
MPVIDSSLLFRFGLVGFLLCVVRAGLALSATGNLEVTTPNRPSSEHTADDSLDVVQDRMVAVGTWVFDHNGLFGEVDRGNVTWTFTADGMMTITNSDETHTRTYSLTKHCGGYGKIAERDVAYLKIKSDGSLEDCYVISGIDEVGPPEGKVLNLMTSNGTDVFLIPAK